MNRRLVILPVLLLCAETALSQTSIVDFNSNTGYTNQSPVWTHDIGSTGQPAISASITVDSLLFSAGFTGARLLASNDTSFSFNDPDYIVGQLDRTTNPTSSSFYPATFSLNPTQLAWLNDGGNLNFELVAPPLVPPGLINTVTFYLDKSTLIATPVPEPESWALMLAGLTFMGLVARRR